MKQIFEICPNAETLETLVDLLRYENVSYSNTVSKQASKIKILTEALEKMQDELELLQRVVDMQAAELIAARRSSEV